MNGHAPGWFVVPLEDKTVHVTPVNDVVSHVFTEDCICGPTPELVTTNDGGDNWLYIHHSADGREQNEPPTPEPKPT